MHFQGEAEMANVTKMIAYFKLKNNKSIKEFV